MATVTDNCDANPDVWHEDISFMDLPSACDTDGADYIYGADDAEHNGSYEFTRVFYAEDACENENYKANSFCEHTITVLDAIAPSMTVDWPADRTETLDAACNADTGLDMVTASATDNCDGDVTISIHHSDSAPVYTCDGSDGNAEGSYTFTRTWTAIACDDSGNETTQTHDQLFTVNDEIDPTVDISCPDTYSTTLDADCMADTTPAAAGQATAVADDNCDSDVMIDITYVDSAPEYTCDGSDGNAEGSYTFTRTWTALATDDCGNTSSEDHIQTITVTDETAPELSAEAPADAVVQLDENCEADLSTDALGYATQTSSDGCDSDLTVETDYSDSVPAAHLQRRRRPARRQLRLHAYVQLHGDGRLRQQHLDQRRSVDYAPGQHRPEPDHRNPRSGHALPRWRVCHGPQRCRHRHPRHHDRRQLRQRCGQCVDLRGQ